MSLSKTIILSFILVLGSFLSSTAQVAVNETEARTLITLLDYIAKDYDGAVDGGQIINDAEYEEISDFVQICITYHENLIPQVNNQSFTALSVNLQKLKQLIESKSTQELIETQTKKIKGSVLSLGLLKMIPDKWPVLKTGMMIYEQKCQSCHGENGGGDGILAAGLDPSPTDFLDAGTLKNLTPIQAYNVAKLGLTGTAMRSFSELSDADLWNVSFYILALGKKTDANDIKTLPKGIILDSVSQWTNLQLENALLNVPTKVTASQIRHYEPQVLLPLDFATQNLNTSLQAYLDGDKKGAQQLALIAYLEGIEMVEKTLKAIDNKLVIDIEKAMLAYRNALKGEDQMLVTSTNKVARDLVGNAQEVMRNKSYSFGFTFGAALSILLREALEALLIIVVILSVLRPLKIRKAIQFLHAGWIIAVITGIISWIFVDQLVKISGSSRELMEGVGSLIAVVILIYMGTWLHSKSEIQKWKEFIGEKINKLSESGNWWGLMFFSFIVVFREAFEVVLFLSALKLDVPEASGSPIGWAVLASAILVILFAVLIMHYSKRLPIKQIFKISAITMAVLAIVLVGKGFSALQEAGIIEMNLVSDWIRFEPLGIYPTTQTLGAQIFIILLVFALWMYSERTKKELVLNQESSLPTDESETLNRQY